jgi:hypothetical protein
MTDHQSTGETQNCGALNCRASFQKPLGGTGLRPVVSGVAPETVAGRGQLWVSANQPQLWLSAAEIRRDAGFDGPEARATQKTRAMAGADAGRSAATVRVWANGHARNGLHNA